MISMASLATLVTYTLQGIFLGLVDETLPPMAAKAHGTLSISSSLALVKLPLALKFFIAPFVDHAGSSALKSILAYTQLFACLPLALLFWSIDSYADQSSLELIIGVLVLLGVAIAAADVVVDVYALHEAPRHRALFQVVGIMCGRFLGNTTFVILHHSFNFMLSHLILAIGLATFGLFWLIYVSSTHHDHKMKDQDEKTTNLLYRVYHFFTRRSHMTWWILHQLIPPACYFHLEVLRCRFAQVGGSAVTEAAAVTDGLVFLPTLLLLIYLDSAMGTSLRKFAKFYVIQVMVSLGLVYLYLQMGSLVDHETTGYIYGVFMRVQDTLFFLYEMSEFHFYGEVASLDPAIGATLLALQTSIFNLSEVLHPALASLLVESTSSCVTDINDRLVCETDTYPFWAVILTLAGVSFYLIGWLVSAFPAYTDIKDKGWFVESKDKNDKPLIGNLTILFCLGILTCGVIGSAFFEI